MTMRVRPIAANARRNENAASMKHASERKGITNTSRDSMNLGRDHAPPSGGRVRQNEQAQQQGSPGGGEPQTRDDRPVQDRPDEQGSRRQSDVERE